MRKRPEIPDTWQPPNAMIERPCRWRTSSPPCYESASAGSPDYFSRPLAKVRDTWCARVSAMPRRAVPAFGPLRHQVRRRAVVSPACRHWCEPSASDTGRVGWRRHPPFHRCASFRRLATLGASRSAPCRPTNSGVPGICSRRATRICRSSRRRTSSRSVHVASASARAPSSTRASSMIELALRHSSLVMSRM